LAPFLGSFQPFLIYSVLASSDVSKIEELNETLCREVSNVNEWAKSNHLPLNGCKTRTILIDGSRLRNRLSQTDRILDIQLEGKRLEQVDHFKLLGLAFDEKLSFASHIESLCKKLSKRIGILNKIKSYLPRSERVLYYNSMIKPLILYGSVSWSGCCSKEYINMIFKLQKRCARVILDAHPRHSSIDLFNTLGWVPFYVEADVKRCLVAYKRSADTCPDYIKDLLILNGDQHKRNTRSALYTILPPMYNRVKEGGCTFSVTTAKCWNYLPLKLRTCSSIYIFKKELYRKHKTNQINDKVFNPFLDNLL
jgi:hypothetical protein